MKALASLYISEALSESSGIEVLPLTPCEALDTPVNTHADMLTFVLENKIFTYGSYYSQNKQIFDAARSDGYEIIAVSRECSKKYPNDIMLNALVMGKTLYANLKHIAKEIINIATELGYTLINVKQGYSACSTLALDADNAITADKGMYRALCESGKKAVLISEKGIKLDGYNCGFIGGASCVIGKNVYFYGEIQNHPDYEKIHKKLVELSMNEISILAADVVDFGGARLF